MKIDKDKFKVHPLRDVDRGGFDDPYLEQKITDAWNHNDFVSGIVFGEQGVGKSSYALQLMYTLYQDWEKVFEHLYYDPEEFFVDVKAKEQGRRWKMVLIDDAGVGWSKYRFFSDKKFTRMASAFYQIARSETACLLMTAPNPQELLRSYRNMDNYTVKITYSSDKWTQRRQAIIYKQIVTPFGGKNIQERDRERFDVYLPEPVFEYYNKIRATYREDILPELLEEIKEAKKERKQEKKSKKSEKV